MTRRFAGGALVAVGVTVLLTGCGLAPAADPSAVGPPVSPGYVVEFTAIERSDGHERPAESVEPAVPTGDPGPCTADTVEAEFAEGDRARPRVWRTAVVLTNVGASACELIGMSEIEFAGPSGNPIDITQWPLDNGMVAGDLVTVEQWEQASMVVEYSSAPERCPSPRSARLTLFGDDQPLEVRHPGSPGGMPPLCGETFSAGPWVAGRGR